MIANQNIVYLRHCESHPATKNCKIACLSLFRRRNGMFNIIVNVKLFFRGASQESL